jgi:hypothetical protein
MALFETEITKPLNKKAHFIYFYNEKSRRTPEWDLMRYLAIKSFHQHNPDYEINFYTNKAPYGDYWDRVSHLINLKMTEPPTEVFGNPLVHPAHVSDVFRIQIMNQEGGVYSDFDTITVKSFDDLLAEDKFLIGKLGTRDWKYNNGVFVSNANSKYLQEWYQEYTWFRSTGKDTYWDEHSVKLHSTLIQRESLNGHFKILPWEAFYPFRYTELEKLYDKFMPEKVTPATYSVHLFDSSICYKKIQSWSEKRILEEPETCSYSYIAAKYLQ